MDTLPARTRIWHVVALLLLCTLPAQALTPLDAGSMEARVLIANSVSLTPESTRGRVTEATGTLSWFPRESPLQDVLSLETSPTPSSRTDERIVFTWTNPDRTEDILIESRVRTRNAIVPVREHIAFPLSNIPADISVYLGEGEITNQDAQIQQLAQSLAAGKDDAYEVVFTLADWTTRNVNYSLASLRAPAIQTSSQVLQSKYGKCDEITALFISLSRSLGIPARFVAGYSYTNSDLFTQQWGGHGWAEVWLPGQGWIPFDVTYGEYGYLDAGHIQLTTALDAKETSVDYSASGYDFKLQTAPLDIVVTPQQLEELQDDRIHITLDAPYKTVGFGSIVLVLARVENLKDYYVSTRLDLAHTSNTQMLSDTYHNVLLKPRETITVPFLVRVDSDLNRKYLYEFPFRLTSRLGESERITIDVTPQARVYTSRDYDDIIEQYVIGTPDTTPFGITCERATGYVGSVLTHPCTVSGTVGDRLRICQAQQCSDVTVENGAFTLTNTAQAEGTRTLAYEASALGVATQFFVTERTVTSTIINVEVEAPASMTPDEIVPIAFTLTHAGAQPRDLTVDFSARHSSTSEHLVDLAKPARMEFTLPGRALRPGENVLEVDITYTDELGTPGTAHAEARVLLTDVGLVDRLSFWLEDAGYWLESLVS